MTKAQQRIRDAIEEFPRIGNDSNACLIYLENNQETIQTALRALEALCGDGGWQDISTAPRDGTAILVAKRTDIYGLVVGSSYWFKDDFIGGGWLSIGLLHIDGERIDLGLAHPDLWMPLPDQNPAHVIAKEFMESGDE